MEPDDIVGDVNTDGTQEIQQTQEQQPAIPAAPENNGNPAWAELYEVLPTSLHGIARPVLEKWESNTQAKFNEYAENLRKFEPYSDFVGQAEPDQIRNALQVAQMLDADPRAFMAQLQAYVGQDTSQQQPQNTQQPNGQQQTQQPDGEFDFNEAPFDLANDPQFKQIAEQQQIIADFLARDLAQKQQAEEDRNLEQTLSSLKATHGDYDEKYVLGLMLNGSTPEDAVKSYKEIEARIANKPRSDAGVPQIVPPGGGMPQESIDPANMSTSERKALVMQILAEAAKNNG